MCPLRSQLFRLLQKLPHPRPQLGPHAHVWQAEEHGRVAPLCLHLRPQPLVSCSRGWAGAGGSVTRVHAPASLAASAAQHCKGRHRQRQLNARAHAGDVQLATTAGNCTAWRPAGGRQEADVRASDRTSCVAAASSGAQLAGQRRAAGRPSRGLPTFRGHLCEACGVEQRVVQVQDEQQLAAGKQPVGGALRPTGSGRGVATRTPAFAAALTSGGRDPPGAALLSRLAPLGDRRGRGGQPLQQGGRQAGSHARCCLPHLAQPLRLVPADLQPAVDVGQRHAPLLGLVPQRPAADAEPAHEAGVGGAGWGGGMGTRGGVSGSAVGWGRTCRTGGPGRRAEAPSEGLHPTPHRVVEPAPLCNPQQALQCCFGHSA